MIWYAFAINSGVNIKSVLGAAKELSNLKEVTQNKDQMLGDLTEQLDTFLSLTSNSKQFNCLTYCRNQICIGRKYGNYLFFFFLLVKGFYILNIIAQLYFMSAFLGSSWFFHGFNVFFALLHHRRWLHSDTFPIQTLCDYSAFQQGSLLHHQCQCVLPVNLYNDKIFAFLTLYLTGGRGIYGPFYR